MILRLQGQVSLSPRTVFYTAPEAIFAPRPWKVQKRLDADYAGSMHAQADSVTPQGWASRMTIFATRCRWRRPDERPIKTGHTGRYDRVCWRLGGYVLEGITYNRVMAAGKIKARGSAGRILISINQCDTVQTKCLLPIPSRANRELEWPSIHFDWFSFIASFASFAIPFSYKAASRSESSVSFSVSPFFWPKSNRRLSI